jgi:hypothetical protein
MEYSLYALLITNLVCSSIYTSYIFCAQVIIFPLINERYYADHIERSTKAYALFLGTEFVTSILLASYEEVLIIPIIILLIAYIFMILMYRLEDTFIDHIITEQYDRFRLYGWIICGLCFTRWCFMYLYVLTNH